MMVNDINTLNGSLQALGEKMASNLTAMGVPSTYDEGLNTLADKILQVAPVKTLDHINVELIAGSQILSYADEQQTPDSQYATVRFVAYDVDNNVIPNLALDFQVGSGAVTSVVTDSNGRYEYTYHSQGVGDVEIVASKTVEGILVSKTYELQDCQFYDDMTVANSKYTISGTLLTNEHNNNGWKYNASSLVWIDPNTARLTDGASIEFTPTECYSGSNGSLAPIMIYFENQSQTRVYFIQANTYVQVNSSTKHNHNISLNSEYRLEYTSNAIKLYLGDTLVGSASHSLGTNNIKVRIATGSERYCRIKDFKIKPL